MKKTKSRGFLALFLTLALIITGAFAFLTSRDNADNVFTMGKVKIVLHEDDWYDENDNLKSDYKTVDSSLAELKVSLADSGYTVTEGKSGDNDMLTATKGDEVLIYTDDGTNVYESNGINDFAENILPNNIIGKSPYIENVGNNPTYAYININIPVLSLYKEGSDELEEMEFFTLLDDDGNEGVNDGWNLMFDNDNKVVDGIACNSYTYVYENELQPGETTPSLFSNVKICNFSSHNFSGIKYTSYMYSKAEQTTTTTQSPLSISPFISASAYEPGDDVSQPDQVVTVTGDTSNWTLGSTQIIHDSTDTSMSDANMFRKVMLFKVSEVKTKKDLNYCSIYIDDGTGQYVNYDPEYSYKLSSLNVGEDDFIMPMLEQINIVDDVFILSLDDGKTHKDVTLEASIHGGSQTTYLNFEDHKADIIASLGTDAVDISFASSKAEALSNYYDEFETVYSTYQTDLPTTSTFYSILESIRKDTSISNTNKARANAFLEILNEGFNSTASKIMFYNIRKAGTDSTSNAFTTGTYVPVYSNTNGDTEEPYNFFLTAADDNYLDPVLVFAEVFEDDNSMGQLDNISSINLDASGFGIQSSVADTALEAYAIGSDEQGWECKEITLNYFDPVENQVIETQKVKYGKAFNVKDSVEGTYWYNYEELSKIEDGERILADSLEDITILRAYDDITKYLTFSYYQDDEDGNTAYLTACNVYAMGDALIPETVTKDGITYTVTGVGGNVFNQCNYLTSLTFPKTLTSVSPSSAIISQCNNLKSVEFKADTDGYVNFSEISNVVSSCDKLETFILPEYEGTLLASSLLCNCPSITELTINNWFYTTSSNGIFNKLPNLAKVTLTSPVKEGYYEKWSEYTYHGWYYYNHYIFTDINQYFNNCSNLKTAYVADGAGYPVGCSYENYNKEYHESIFDNIYFSSENSDIYSRISICQYTTKSTLSFEDNNIAFSNTNIYYGSNENGWSLLEGSVILTNETNTGLPGYSRINKVYIGENVKDAGNFLGCSNLTEIQIDSLQTDVSGKFDNCGDASINKVTFNENCTSEALGFVKNYYMETITVPAGSTKVIDGALYNICAKNVIYAEGITEIGKYQAGNYYSTGSKYKNAVIQSIFVPTTVTTLGEECFANMAIKQVTFEKGCVIKTFPEELFYCDYELASFNWPDELETIERYAFNSCESLSSIVFPTSVKTIGSIGNISGTACLYIPASVEDFAGGDNYGTIQSLGGSIYTEYAKDEIPSSWGAGWNKYRKYYSGTYCYYEYPTVYSKYGFTTEEIDGVTFYYEDEEKTVLKKVITDEANITLPSTIIKIQRNAFNKCNIINLYGMTSDILIYDTSFNNVVNVFWTDVDIEEAKAHNYYGAKIINGYTDEYAVYNNANKTELLGIIKLNDNNGYDMPSTVTTIADEVFNNYKTTLENITISSNISEINDDMFNGFSALKTVTFTEGDKITNIGNNGFRECTVLENISLPDSIKTIGTYAFWGCTSLTDIKLPDSLETIGSYAFGSTALVSIDFNDGLLSIGDESFSKTALTEITIPNTVASIGQYAFSDCTSLAKVTHKGSGNGCGYGYEVFYNDTSLNEVVFEDDNVIAFDSTNFTNNNITKLTLGNGVDISTIKNKLVAYSLSELNYNIPSLTEQTKFGLNENAIINIGKDVTVIPQYFVSDKTVEFNVSEENTVLTTISPYAFYKATITNNSAINLNYVKTVGTYGFAEASVANGINLNSVETIASYAFKKCNLEVITFPDTLKTIGLRAFDSCSNLKEVTIPDSVTSIGNYAFYGSGIETITLSSNMETVSEGLLGYCMSLENIVIPNSVKTIEAYAFQGCQYLQSVEPSNTLESIGNYAFENCTGLTSISLPDTLVSIGNYAFSKAGLKSVTIPKATISLGTGAFSSSNVETATFLDTAPIQCEYLFNCCSKLTSVNLGKEITLIDNYMFYKCSELNEITLSEKISSVGYYAFASCAKIKNINLPSTVTSIGRYAFSGCTELSLEIPEATVTIASCAFEYCDSLSEINIPSTTTTLSSYAFYKCNGITSVSINSSEIGSYAFAYCSSLSSIIIGENVTTISSNAFYNASKVLNVNIPDNVNSIGSKAFYDVANITYSENMTATGSPWGAKCANGYIEDNFVYSDNTKTTLVRCTANNMEEITISDTVTEIKSYAFYDSSNITNIIIPDTVTTIGTNAFYNVANITYSENMTATGSPWGALQTNKYCEDGLVYSDNTKTTIVGCSHAMSGELIIPDTVTTIETGAFNGCTNLTKANIGENVININSKAFYGCTGLTEISVPSTVTTLGSYAFYNCKNIETASIGSIKIEASALENCYKLSNVTISDSLESIGDNGFNCTALTTFSIPDSVTSIGKLAFYKCPLTELTIGNGLTEISNGMLRGCTQLKTINIPDNITSISENAFYDCTGLTEITTGKNVVSIGSSAFYNCKGLKEITIDKAVTNIGAKAFYGTLNVEKLTWNATSCSDFTSSNDIFSFMGDNLGGFDVVINGNIPAYLFCGSYTSNNKTYRIGVKTVNIIGGETIGNSAFYSCDRLTSVAMADTITSIGNTAFYNCSKLSNITLSSNLVTIGNSAFYGCIGIESLILPETLTEIQSGTFACCYNLANVVIPSNISTIASDAFTSVPNVINKKISYTLTGKYGAICCNGYAEDGIVYSSDNKTTVYGVYYNTTDVIFPEGVESITGCKGNTSLKSVIIPSTVKNINSNAFYQCTSLKTVTINDAEVYIGAKAFGYCTSLNSAYLGKATYLEENIFYGDTYLTTVSFNSNANTGIGANSFYDLPKLTTVNLGYIRYIGSNAFYSCESLTDITLKISSSSVGVYNTYISSYAFGSCTALTTVTLEGPVSGIDSHAFYECTALTSINIPETVTFFGKCAFYNCTSLTLYIPSSVTSKGTNCLYNVKKVIYT